MAAANRLATVSPENFFKLLSDSLRLEMILMLLDTGELCVCEFVASTGMSQPKVSRHLAPLRKCGLLLDRKDKRWVYYRVNPELPSWMFNILNTLAREDRVLFCSDSRSK